MRPQLKRKYDSYSCATRAQIRSNQQIFQSPSQLRRRDLFYACTVYKPLFASFQTCQHRVAILDAPQSKYRLMCGPWINFSLNVLKCLFRSLTGKSYPYFYHPFSATFALEPRSPLSPSAGSCCWGVPTTSPESAFSACRPSCCGICATQLVSRSTLVYPWFLWQKWNG